MASPLETTLLLTDQQRSVLYTVNAQTQKPRAYTVYGHRPAESGMTCLLGFNGEPPDPVTGHYLLGNGYRAFNPVLMRFNSPDSLSPFGEGGLNGYAYCGGDPVNRVDPTGHSSGGALIAKNIKKIITPSQKKQLSSVMSSELFTRKLKVSAIASGSASPPSTLKKPIHAKPRGAKKREIEQSSVQKPISVEHNSWTYSKFGAQFSKGGLTKSAQEKFDIFQNSIHHRGLSHIEAAKLAGDADLKKLGSAKIHQYQIRLDQNDRVTYSIDKKTVKILQVGGHT
jgi:RHS repeat-associated protein